MLKFAPTEQPGFATGSPRLKTGLDDHQQLQPHTQPKRALTMGRFPVAASTMKAICLRRVMALAQGEGFVAGVVAPAVGVSPRVSMPRKGILTYVYEWAWTVWASGPRQR
ncbi:unnamed protein product, partial [Ectocarpus sp. 13 AM-2016]